MKVEVTVTVDAATQTVGIHIPHPPGLIVLAMPKADALHLADMLEKAVQSLAAAEGLRS